MSEELNEFEKEMIGDMLVDTRSKDDIKRNVNMMEGSCALPSKKCIETYKELAEQKIKRIKV